jgi:multiple sugar transport system ATP-binding protein
MSAIAIENVSKRYRDGTLAVHDFDLEIGDGEFMILVGPSGCGKTTLLRMLAGLEQITEGTISIGGQVVNDLEPRQRDIAMVFQNYALYPHMTVARNMGFALRRAGVPKADIDRRVAEAAELLGISEQLDRKPANLSGGQRQRVAMGRAIVREPQAFLMDEPLSNLDAKLRIQTRAEIVRIQRRLSTTTVYVTHDQVEAMTLGDRLAVMRDGILQQVGAPGELYGAPRNLFVAGFIGSPPMNFMIGRVRDGALHSPLGAIPLERVGPHGAPDGVGGDPVVVGVRPEDFEDAALVSGRGPGITLSARVDVLESTGSDVYAHLAVDDPGEGAGSEATAALEAGLRAAEGQDGAAPGLGGPELVARVDSSTGLREGETGELWLDTTRLHLFDARSGDRIAV